MQIQSWTSAQKKQGVLEELSKDMNNNQTTTHTTRNVSAQKAYRNNRSAQKQET